MLDSLGFEPSVDTLWLTGDLVNRGPDSLRTLRFAIELGEGLRCVLGNHDLHLLAVSQRPHLHRRKDTLTELLEAADRDQLLTWLARLPLVYRDRQLGYALVHAGLVPQWSVADALRLSAEVQSVIASDRAAEFFVHMYGDEPHTWDPALSGWDRLRFITNVLTRLRFCTPQGRMDFSGTGPPGTQPAGYLPWFEVPQRRSRNEPIVFGHWAALRLAPESARRLNAFHLDTGCVWGDRLTAINLETRELTSVPCPQPQTRPKRRSRVT